jgi:hypothetical protein
MIKGVPTKGNTIISSWCIATKPQPRNIWPTSAIIWEAADPYLYIQTTPSGQVICGGEDEEISDAAQRDAKIADKTATLCAKLGKLLPQLDATAAFAWAGSFGDSTTGQLLRRNGLWRQWHYLFNDDRANVARDDHGEWRPGCRSGQFYAQILNAT